MVQATLMKPRPTLHAPASQCDESRPDDPSAEALVRREIGKLGAWLAAQGIELESEHVHADEGSRDRLYLRYGYFMGLKQALALLTSRGKTLH